MIEGDRQPLSAHKTVELVCRATGSRPPAVISWWKGTSKLKALKDNISVDGNVTTSIITMTPSSEDNGKHLSCRAENSLIAGSAIEYGWKLEVHCSSNVLSYTEFLCVVLKTHSCIVGLMVVESVIAKSPHVGLLCKLEEKGASCEDCGLKYEVHSPDQRVT
ncbi:uncharacterized protein TNCV_579051 [Trichonephila clavipes]|nr:uncharacterized protein TNCV_579051 [Trichonephila clavipes]